MSAKTYRQIFNPGEPRQNPFNQSEDVLYVERGRLNARCRKSDISKFSALVASVCIMFVCLSVYWISVKNMNEQSKEDLEHILADKESRMVVARVNKVRTVKSKKAQCFEEMIVGDCKGVFPRWYYDSREDICLPFTYSGCNGTSNNFKTLEECATSCISHKYDEKQDICTLSLDPGPCKGSHPRYHYNPHTRLCEKFIYGGCGGNDNNFRTVKDCQTKCDDQLSNPFSEEVNLCTLAPERGPCRGSIARWYFNNVQKTCKKFIFGGCLPNKNNFLSEEDCLERCGERKAPSDVCSLPIDAGNCKALLPRFAFDSKTNDCIKFEYSGCEGNENRFGSLEECKKSCGVMETEGDDKEDEEKQENDILILNTTTPRPVDCTSKPVRGSCRGNFLRFYFNGSECKTFIFGGCDGNGNNFESEEKCMSACSSQLN